MRLDIAVAGLCCLVTATEAFAPMATFTTPTSKKNRVALLASTFSETDVNVDVDGVKPSQSSRLTRAKLLLEEFTMTDESDSKTTADGDSGDATATTTAMTVSATRTRTTSPKTRTSKTSKTAASTKTIVPDSFWRNGHLQGGSNTNYVTRWAQGVKVAEPLVKYDPVAAEKLLFRQPAKWVLRNFQIALPIGWWAAGVVGDFVLGQSMNRRARAQQLTQAISGLGPAIIKGGQALASRPDLLPFEYLEELQKLQDDVPRFSNQRALATVREELGKEFNEIFELVQEEPVAAASIGQVCMLCLCAFELDCLDNACSGVFVVCEFR